MDDKMTFFQQLSTLISSGTPLMQAIMICAEQSQSVKMRRVLDEIGERIAAGSPLYLAAADHPDLFEPHWIEVIHTGEITGKMGTVLLELNKQIRETRETMRKQPNVMGWKPARNCSSRKAAALAGDRDTRDAWVYSK